MSVDTSQSDRVLAQIDRDELAQLACDLVNIRSATGLEQELADFILDWYRANGLKAIRQEVEAGRLNAVGILKGRGGGLSLMFNGHMDTSFTGTNADLEILAEIEPESELRGSIGDDAVRGLGASNNKGGIAAFMIAGKALKASGVTLKGDVILAAVAGEISRTPVGPYQARDYRGEGAGTRHLLTHGIHSDYALVADASDLNIVWSQNGVVDFKITTRGKPQTAWGTRRSTHPMGQFNAIVKMTRIIEAIEQWAEAFEDRYIYQSPTGPLYPKVNIGAIAGGAAYRPVFFPATCSIYVDVRTPPRLRPITVQHELEQVLNGLDIDYELEGYRSLLGHEGVGVEPLVESIQKVHQHLFGQPIQAEAPNRASIWTDTNVYNEMGIPAVKVGPKGSRPGPRTEEIKIDDMLKAAQIYALVALDICNRERG